jgi:hypothetical protein
VLTFTATGIGSAAVIRSDGSTTVNNINSFGRNQWYKVSCEMRQTAGTVGKNLSTQVYSLIVTFLGESNVVASTGDWQEVSVIVNTNRTTTLLIYPRAALPAANDVFEVRNLSVRHLRGNHCQQFTLTKFPSLQQDSKNNYYLYFYGSDDFLQCPYSLVNSGDGLGAYVCAGVTKDSDTLRGMIFGYNTTDDTTNNSLSLYAPSADTNTDYGFQAKGSSGPVALTAAATAPDTSVLTGLTSSAAPYTKLRVNGVEQATNSTTLGTMAINGNLDFFVGGRKGTSLFFNGRLYGLIFVPSQANFEKVTTAERYINERTQAY